MGLHLLMWRLFALILVTDGMTEFCAQDPPTISNATFKALMYKTGTLLNCECKRGFRRLDKGFMNCTESLGHTSWANQCQCRGTSSREREKQVTPKPEEQKERNTTDVQSPVQPSGPANPPGHCKEPPPWEHEALKRIYHFVVGQTLHYECTQGFRALQRGPAVSTCKSICGKARWTRPQLKCTKERTDSQGPGDEEPQASTDTPAGSETSCPLVTTDTTTTDFQKHTAVATTTETVIFTTKYQMAVAVCVLLLISILLLSGLTWQQRWRKSRRSL